MASTSAHLDLRDSELLPSTANTGRPSVLLLVEQIQIVVTDTGII
jgi:hypothetical protein